jgi:hypothetical protein
MFREASAIDSERTATSVRTLYSKYSANDNWFDGTPDSVDRRIAQAKKISNISKQASVRFSGRNAASQYIALAAEMDGDRAALEGLRRDLLTASSDRYAADDDSTKNVDWERIKNLKPSRKPTETGKHVMRDEEASDYHPGWDLPAVERDPGDYKGKHRAEARYFIAEQECDDLQELTIRAKHFAERVSSTLPAEQSRQFVASFVGAVRNEYEPPRQQRTAASNYTQDFPAEFLYFE